MFPLIRFFLTTSAVVMVTLVVAVVFYRSQETRRLIEFAEGQNVTVAQSFANTLRLHHPSLLAGARARALSRQEERAAVNDTLGALGRELPVLKVKLYRPDGLTIYSSDYDEIGSYAEINPGLRSAERGIAASKLTFRDQVSPFSGDQRGLDVVESYLPIRGDGGAVEGIFELYTDVTPFVRKLRASTVNLALAAAGLIGPLYAILLLVVWRADRTIKRQYADIAESNANLRREVLIRRRAEGELTAARNELERRVAERTRRLEEEVAERQRAEERARRHRSDLTQMGAVLTMGEMATSIAHEINQPLTVISGAAQFCLERLRGGAADPGVLGESLQQVVEQAKRAHEIVRRVRGFIRKEPREATTIDVNDAIHGVADFLRIDAREYSSDVEFDLAAALPRVRADPIQIQQVVLNLAHNGLEAMAESGRASRRLTIRTAVDRAGEVEVTVSDTGCGMPADVLRRVFDPFFTTKSGGLGMGLAISRSIMEAHGGRIWATSEPGAGSTFAIQLPAAIESGATADGA